MVRQIRIIDVLNLLIILLIVGYVAYAKFFPFNVIDVTNLTSEGKIPMVEKRVEVGHYAKYDIETQRHTSDTITVIRNIINGQTIPLSASLSNRPAGPGDFVVEVLLPVNLNPGIYSFRICYEAEFALDRTVTECFQTEDFEVYLPEGADPDDDGIVVPQDGTGTNMAPSIQGSPSSTLDNNENGSTPTNLRESPETQQRAENPPAQGGNDGPAIRDEESFLCRTTGLEVKNPLQLPVTIC